MVKKFMAGLVLVLGIAFSQRVDAQQLFMQGNCVHQTSVQSAQPSPLVGCYAVQSGRLCWAPANGGGHVIQDHRTGAWLSRWQGVQVIWTTQGWWRSDQHPVAQQINAEIDAWAKQSGQAPQGPGTRIIIENQWSPEELAIIQRQSPGVISQLNDIRASQDRMTNAWTAPPPRPYYGR